MSKEKYLQFRIDYCVDDGAIFLLSRAKLFTEKLGSHKISNILSPWFEHQIKPTQDTFINVLHVNLTNWKITIVTKLKILTK